MEQQKTPYEEYYRQETPFDAITDDSKIKCAYVNLFYDNTWKNIEATHGIAYSTDIIVYLEEIDEFILELIDYRNRLKSKYDAEIEAKEEP